MNLTDEQKAIIGSAGNIKINAVAGSGKTTTIIQYAASKPADAKILYLAFNKSVRLEARKKFNELGLHNVQVETAHSLAYKHVVAKNGYQVCQSNYSIYQLAGILGLKAMGEKHGEFILASHIQKFFSYFCNSPAARVQDLNYLDIVTEENARAFARNFYRSIEQGTRILLAKMHKGTIEVTHDFYLKMFQHSQPRLPFDFILFDEGQDASPAMLDIFLHQQATKVIVGDTHQQIYSWRHAVNSLGKVDFPVFHLTASFRFGEDIARLAKAIVGWKTHLDPLATASITGLGKAVKLSAKAIIARTNLGLLLNAITYITENQKVKKIYFEGNIHSYTYADDGASLYDVLNLYNGKKERIRDPLIASMQTIDDLEEYIGKTEDVQLGMMLDIVKEYENEIPALIKSLKSKHVGDEEKATAEVIFSTVHRAKGMEYDSVQLADDFVSEAKLERAKFDNAQKEPANLAKWMEEINLLYVAITRTRSQLIIPELLLPKNFHSSPNIQVIKTVNEKTANDTAGLEIFKVNNQRRKSGRAQKEKPEKTYSYAEKRLTQKNAYERWTEEDEWMLRMMFESGEKLSAIANHFHRNRGAILSRLRKLGLEYEE